MLCECGLSHSQIVMYLTLLVMMWEDIVPVWWDEVRWSFPCNSFGPRSSMGNWTLRQWDLICREGTTVYFALRLPLTLSWLQARLFPISTSALLKLTTSFLAQEPVLVFHFLLKHSKLFTRNQKFSYSSFAVHSYFSYSSFPSTLL